MIRTPKLNRPVHQKLLHNSHLLAPLLLPPPLPQYLLPPPLPLRKSPLMLLLLLLRQQNLLDVGLQFLLVILSLSTTIFSSIFLSCRSHHQSSLDKQFISVKIQVLGMRQSLQLQ